MVSSSSIYLLIYELILNIYNVSIVFYVLLLNNIIVIILEYLEMFFFHVSIFPHFFHVIMFFLIQSQLF